MSQQAKAHCDLVGIVTIDEYGDDIMLIKKNNGSTDDVVNQGVVGTSITMEEHDHPSHGVIIIPVIRRGQCPFNNRTLRILEVK